MSQANICILITIFIYLVGMLASTMSTADSQLLAASSSVSQNLLQEAMGLKLSPKAGILVIAAVSLLTKKPSAQIEAEFDLAKGNKVIGHEILL